MGEAIFNIIRDCFHNNSITFISFFNNDIFPLFKIVKNVSFFMAKIVSFAILTGLARDGLFAVVDILMD